MDRTVRVKSKWLLPLVAATAVLALAGCNGGGSDSTSAASPAPPASSPPPANTPPPATPDLSGSVMGGTQPVPGAMVVAYAVGTGAGAEPIELGANITDSNGKFQLSFSSQPEAGNVIYVTARGGHPGVSGTVGMMTVGGAWCASGTDGCVFPDTLTINETTTVAATAALASFIQFADCAKIANNSSTGTCAEVSGAPGLAGAAAAFDNLVDPASGAAAKFLTAQPDTSPLHLTLERMNTLASVLAACVEADPNVSDNACDKLFTAVGNKTADTLNAAWHIASDAATNANGAALFTLLPAKPAFSPVLSAEPAGWSIGGQRFAYVANAAGSVSVFRVDPATGALAAVTSGGATSCYGPGGPPFDPQNCFAAAIAPASIAISPNGRFVFVGNCEGGGNNISVYAADPGTGALTEVAGSPFVGGDHPFSVKVDPTGRYLFVADIGPGEGGPPPRQGAVSVYSIDANTGVLTPVAGSPFNAGDQAYAVAPDPSGRYLYVTNNDSHSVSAYTIAPASGALAPIAGTVSCGSGMPTTCFDAGTQPWKIAADASGKFVYAVNFDSNSISAWSIDASSGALKPVAGQASCGTGLAADCFEAGDFPIGIVADPAGEYVFVINCGNGDGHDSGVGSGSVEAFAINADTGALTLVNSVGSTLSPHWGAVDPSGHYLYVANMNPADQTVGNNVSVYAIDPATGALSEVAGSPFFAGPGANAVAVSP